MPRASKGCSDQSASPPAACAAAEGRHRSTGRSHDVRYTRAASSPSPPPDANRRANNAIDESTLGVVAGGGAVAEAFDAGEGGLTRLVAVLFPPNPLEYALLTFSRSSTASPRSRPPSKTSSGMSRRLKEERTVDGAESQFSSSFTPRGPAMASARTRRGGLPRRWRRHRRRRRRRVAARSGAGTPRGGGAREGARRLRR